MSQQVKHNISPAIVQL